MKKWIRKLKEKDGWITLLIIFVLSTILPIFLFFFVELNYLYGLKDNAQYIADNSASSAVRSINQEQFNAGIIEINNDEAKEVSTELFKRNYKLNDDLTVNEDSMLREDPAFKTYVINPVSDAGEPFTTDEGYTYTIYHPTVIVYTSVKPKGVFFNKVVNLQTISIHEVKKKNVETRSETSNPTEPSPTPTSPPPTEPSPNPNVTRYIIPIPDISHIPSQGNFTGYRRITDGTGKVLYEGRWSNGKFHGFGTLYDANGRLKYSGSWSNGLYNTHGTSYNADGSKFYEGNTANGVPDGYGTYYGSDGVMDYQGQFENGYREGWGTTYEEDGTSTSGNNTDVSNPPPPPPMTMNDLLFEKVYTEE